MPNEYFCVVGKNSFSLLLVGDESRIFFQHALSTLQFSRSVRSKSNLRGMPVLATQNRDAEKKNREITVRFAGSLCCYIGLLIIKLKKT